MCCVVVAERHGLSSDRFAQICARLQGALDDDLVARNALLHKDLIAFDGHGFQVRALPPKPGRTPPRPLHSPQPMAHADPAPIGHILRNSLGADHD